MTTNPLQLVLQSAGRPGGKAGKIITSYKALKAMSHNKGLLYDSDESSLSSVSESDLDEEEGEDDDDEETDGKGFEDSEDDEEEDSEDNDSHSSGSDSSLTSSYIRTPSRPNKVRTSSQKHQKTEKLQKNDKNKKAKNVLPLPERLDLRKSKSGSLDSQEMAADDRSRDTVNPVMETVKHAPRQSLVIHDIDDVDFPRSALGSDLEDAAILENLFVDDENDDDDFEDATLLELLDQDDNHSVDGFGEFDAKIEEEEEEAILNEMMDDDEEEEEGNGLSSPSPVSSNWPTDDFKKVEYNDENYDEDDDDAYFSDVSFESKDPISANGIVLSSQVPGQYLSEDDDSYLWSYFFTDSDDSEEEEEEEESEGKHGLSNNLLRSQFLDDDLSGESTDEDLSLPPPSHRKVGVRATEVLSSSNMASRPPLLGTWIMTTERPFGIIDGLTTRTLSPPLAPSNISNNSNNYSHSAPYKTYSRKRSRSQSDGEEFSELALDEFIYTSELSEWEDKEDKNGEKLASSIPVWHRRSDVPLSAFRNRGIQASYTQPMHRRQYMNGRRDKGHASKEVLMTPVKSVNRKLKKRLKNKKKGREQQKDFILDAGVHDYGQTTDLISELVDIGALSPLFSGLS